MASLIYQSTFIFTFICIGILALRQSGKVRSAEGFVVADRSLSASGVSWIIIGTLVGGVSTVGTVQTAYTHGIAAGIFTFGGGLSCLMLGCFFARALREEGVVTVSEYLGRYFGPRFRKFSSAINALGMFLHVIGQFLAAIAILQAVFTMGDVASVLVTMLLIGSFVIAGGISGAGLIGRVKLYMLTLIMVVCAGTALYRGHGIGTIISLLPPDADMLGFSRYGMQRGIIDIVSMVIGVLSTQIYLQAIFSARDVRQARNGAFLAAAIIPPIGLFGIIVGLYLRAYHPEVAANPAQALPYFLQLCFPPVIAAFFSAGILLVVLGTGAGLVLGVTTNMYNDFLQSRTMVLQKIAPIRLIRLTAGGVLLLAVSLVFAGLDSAILRWSYLSMGLRGATVFAGLLVVVFARRYVESRLVAPLLYSLPFFYVILAL